MIDPRFTDRKRGPGLDLLRALAIIVVVIYHIGIFGFALPYDLGRFGWVGVDLFFLLSGYLIGGQLLASLARDGKINFGRFFARRALRIMPAYLVVLAIYFALPALREFPEISPLWKFLLSVQNIDLRGGTAFSHAWSLAVEDQFYLFLPFLLLFVRRWRRVRVIVPCAIVLGGLVLRGVLASQHIGTDNNVSIRDFQRLIYYPTWGRLDPLVFGVTLAAIEKLRAAWWKYLTSHAPWLWLVGLSTIAYGLYIAENDLTVTSCVWQFPLIAFGMATLLICALSPRLPFSRIDIPGATFFAGIAYSVYLSHKLVIHFATQLATRYNLELSSFSAILLVQVLIYLGGVILFLAVERPFLLLRHRIARRPLDKRES